MRYDSDSGKILIELRELVTLARRSLSALPTRDEDEPRLAELTKRRLTKIIGEHSSERLYFGFSSSGREFEITPTADALEDDLITLGRTVASAKAAPTSDESAQVRGEAFILGQQFHTLFGQKRA